jgi:adenylate kinase family enzyme/RimJ/RimL family protein N-acetyltransferase
MTHRIHIFGASGSGVSTLGAHLAREIGGRHLDTDWYYWRQTEPPFTHKRAVAERVAMIEADIEGQENWVLSGSLSNWGDPLLHHFTLAVFLYLDPAVRMARLAARERARYGPLILPGGEQHQQYLEFMAWASSYDHAAAPTRSLDLHERWMHRLTCPIVRLDSSKSVETLCHEILQPMITIALLADHPTAASTLAQWFRAQWPAYYAGRGLAEIARDFHAEAQRGGLPVRLVAFVDGALAGTIVLREQALTAFPAFSPGLGGLFVPEPLRRRGIGTALIRAASSLARDQGHAAVYTATATARGLLEQQGWELVQTVQHGDERLAIFRRMLKS